MRLSGTGLGLASWFRVVVVVVRGGGHPVHFQYARNYVLRVEMGLEVLTGGEQPWILRTIRGPEALPDASHTMGC